MRRLVLLTLVTLLAGATPAAAQSLFSMRGLGSPVAPVDARAAALGGIGVGLLGLNTSLVNPAEISSAYARGVTAGLQPLVDAPALDGLSDRTGATRFPLLHVLYPFGERLVASVGYGGYLDQTWNVVAESESVIGGEPIATTDLVESSGGISQVRVAVAYDVMETLALGVSGGVFVGSREQTVTRSFETSEDGSSGLREFTTRSRRSYRGPHASFGVRWDPVSFLRVGASASWGGELRADSALGRVSSRTIDLPWRVAGGVSAELAPRLIGAVSGQWTGWEGALGLTEADGATDTWDWGGGLEWGGPQFGTRGMPVRLGFRYSDLPFQMNGATPKEWAVGLGLGLRLAGSEDRAAARVDTALERGGRGDAAATGLTEDFWRFTLTMSLFGI